MREGLRRIAQETFQAGFILHQRAIEITRIEANLGLCSIKTELGAEHHVVLDAVLRCGKIERRAGERNAPASQPAHHAMHDDEKKLGGKNMAQRIDDTISDAQARFAGVDDQLRAHVIEDGA